jgi:hypothetical protein
MMILMIIIGMRARKVAEMNYRADKVIEKGNLVIKEKKKSLRKKREIETDEDGDEAEVEEEEHLIDDQDVKKFYWDGKGRFADAKKLAEILEEVCDLNQL